MSSELSRRDFIKGVGYACGTLFFPRAGSLVSGSRVYLDVPFYFQHHTLSCEVAALRMAARYLASAWSEDELLRRMPIVHTQPKVVGDQVVWADPNRAFPGNINGWQLYDNGVVEHPERTRRRLWGYGIHAPALANLATQIGLRAEILHDVSEVYDSINRGRVPIVIVPAGGLPEAVLWEWHTPSGQPVRVMNREHSIVVKGYNAEQVWVNDPKGKVARYERPVFEQAFSLLRSGVAVGRRSRTGPVRHFAL